MIIMELLTPFERLQTWCRTLYFRGENYRYQGNAITIDKGGYLETDTYFNAFSLEKWVRYTRLSDLYLSINAAGKYRVIVKTTFVAKDYVTDRVLFSSEEEGSTRIDLTDYLKEKGMVSFYIEALSDSVTFTASYETSRNYEKPSIALAICTYSLLYSSFFSVPMILVISL